MLELAKTFTAKVKQISQEYPDQFLATAAGDLRCNLCDVLVKYDKKFFVESHRKVNNTKEKWRQKANPKVSKPFLQLDQMNFKEQVVSLLLAADIPLNKLNPSSLKFLFATTGKYCLRTLQPWHVLLN